MYENNILIPRNEEYLAVRFRQLSKLLKARNHKASPEHKDISLIFVPDLKKKFGVFVHCFVWSLLNEIQQHCEETMRIYLCSLHFDKEVEEEGVEEVAGVGCSLELI